MAWRDDGAEREEEEEERKQGLRRAVERAVEVLRWVTDRLSLV